MTRKAVRVLEECPVLAVPRTPAGDSWPWRSPRQVRI